MSVAAWAKSIVAGIGTRESAGTATCSAKPPNPVKAMTLSPTSMPDTPGSHGGHLAGDLAPRDEGRGRFDLVATLADEPVDEVDAGGPHVDHHLALAR